MNNSLFVVFVAFLISFVYFLAVRYFTKTIIYITFILQVAMGVGTSIIYFARHYYSSQSYTSSAFSPGANGSPSPS
jgi:hypothetical protein